MEFGFTRRVEKEYIDLDKMAKDGLINREIESSPNGYYPVLIVPEYLLGKKVLIIPVTEDNIPVTLKDMIEDRSGIDNSRKE